MTWVQSFRPLIVGLLILLPLSGRTAAAEAPGEKIVVVTSNGWHSGIVIARRDLPAGAIPETADFRDAAYFEFGWGDSEYYPAPRKTFAMTLGAAFPSSAVVHLMGLPRHPSQMFPGNEWVALGLSEEGFRQLVAYLHNSFERAGAARVRQRARGLYAFSAFYPATGTFHLFNTCNTWTARGLASAGLPIRVSGVQQAEELMSQLRALAHPARRAPSQ
jgi:uncharacterized protein (TIGR02117 family)